MEYFDNIRLKYMQNSSAKKIISVILPSMDISIIVSVFLLNTLKYMANFTNHQIINHLFFC